MYIYYIIFSVAGSTLQNALPIALQNVKTMDAFNGALKTYLFRAAFEGIL